MGSSFVVWSSNVAKKMKTPKAEQFFFFFCSPLNKYYVIPLDIIHLWSNRYFLLFVWRRRLLLGNHICIFLSTPSGIVFFCLVFDLNQNGHHGKQRQYSFRRWIHTLSNLNVWTFIILYTYYREGREKGVVLM